MDLKLRAINGGGYNSLRKCPGIEHDMGFSDTEFHSRKHLFTDFTRSSGIKNKALAEQFWFDERADGLDFFQEFLCDFDVDEFTIYQKMMSLQRDMFRMKMTHRMKQLQCVEDNQIFLERITGKKHILRKFLRRDYEMDVSFPSRRGIIKWDQEVYNVNEENEWESRSSPSKELEQFSEDSQKFMEQSESITSRPPNPQERSKLCRYFLKGHCIRGDNCGFRHDRSVFRNDRQKVFLGGVPPNFTGNQLRVKLAEEGYTVLNNPKVLRWFSPEVCLGSVEEARRLIDKGSIVIDGVFLRVRPFEGKTKDSRKIPADVVERYVCLGGLPSSTTAKKTRDELGKMGMKVVNVPVVKTGFCPQMTLESIDQAQTLLNFKQTQINGVMVSVRPFVNIRMSSRRRRRKKKKN